MKRTNLLQTLSIVLLMVFAAESLEAQETKATWIWYPGDFEIWLSNQMQNKRTERGAFFPPFWRQDSHFVLIDFHKEFVLDESEEVELYAEGQYNVKLDGKLIEGEPTTLTIPAGTHKLNLKVRAQDHVPAIFVRGKTVVSDGSWLVTNEDKEWIDETGKASDQSGTAWLRAALWHFNSPENRPSAFKLATEPDGAVSMEQQGGRWLVDFGKETFGFVKLHGVKGQGLISLYYGESKEEALATETCETLDRLHISGQAQGDTVLELSKAFRFVNVEVDNGMQLDSVSMLYEYLPVDERGHFRSSDELLNEIWDVSKYTMHLTSREFFVDGIKRDRWIWSGDAYQSYLMNYYLFFDSPSVKRTTLALRGKDPVSSHINTIMDYTFYWFLGIYDYYMYTGDRAFVETFYPRMQSLMDFCLARRNERGFLEGLPGDWIFIDWADGLSKQGEVSFEQLLFCRSLETMKLCAEIVNDKQGEQQYAQLAKALKRNIFASYWDEDKQAFIHSRVDGKPTDQVTRYTNMFAIFFDYLNEAQQQGVKKHVLLNDAVQQITTPYMRFYELEALCTLGEYGVVLDEIRDYWGGMLKLGATSFWEAYDPNKQGAEHYAMYGRPFGKSLCHSWGASPIYLLGKYFLGVKPVSAGYATYVIEPQLGDMEWMEGTVPTPNGDIEVRVTTNEIKVKTAGGTGKLLLRSKTKPTCEQADLVDLGAGKYEVVLEGTRTYTVVY
ncbi:alpha-L-rhamnosidase-related protein [Parapedobacter tibetensis]|uniref:alpha-L-rhamnosidase-related protein n=1 Tax=Parapedobacter tibetensis TaxID=2972951 RepID=UPI00214D9DDD|nr:alpha-L-rhamnosidase C-terminal domain-containing protein [Parapedobacter tibetensis]